MMMMMMSNSGEQYKACDFGSVVMNCKLTIQTFVSNGICFFFNVTLCTKEII